MAVNTNQKVSSNSAKYLKNNKAKVSNYCELCKYHLKVKDNIKFTKNNHIQYSKSNKNKTI